MWTFVWIEVIEPTNNDAQRTLRHAVLRRNNRGGTESLTELRPRPRNTRDPLFRREFLG